MNDSYNNKSSKNWLLIVGGIALVAIVIVLIIAMLSKKENTSSDTKSKNSVISDGVYYDINRDIKSEYSFDEVKKQFAFVVDNTILIFKKNEKVSMLLIVAPHKKESSLQDARFYYDDSDEDIKSNGGDLGTINLGESNATSLQEFATNFKNGKLNDKTIKDVDNVNVLELNEDYFLGSWTEDEDYSKIYEYYYARKIGNTIYYVYRHSVANESADIDILLKEFKSLFSCLSEDDKKEPYIYDKIINTSAVTNQKKISYKDIFSIDNEKVNFIN